MLLVPVARAASDVSVSETYWSDSRNTIGTDGGLVGSGSWDGSRLKYGFEIAWDIELTGGSYTYVYTVTIGKSAKDVSYFILETSNTFTDANLLDYGTTDIEIKAGGFEGPQLFQSKHGMPQAMYGIKVNLEDPLSDSSNTFSFTLVTDRAPVWGNFFAKSGGGTKVWNEGLEVAFPDPTIDTLDYTPWIPVPDTKTAPTPGAAAAGLGMLLTLTGVRRRRASDTASTDRSA